MRQMTDCFLDLKRRELRRRSGPKGAGHHAHCTHQERNWRTAIAQQAGASYVIWFYFILYVANCHNYV
ncbi:unnamed protein product [Trifolium pratense]|uniref:Uncharacterized protein n=1 Tax=Trifolium pratense TaxID=57577 RepID=A0ACB0LDA9_TRIPR|nr:unnamed protein product [Trifolium pratense]